MRTKEFDLHKNKLDLTEFDLSKKIIGEDMDTDVEPVLVISDVKEFIRLLKEKGSIKGIKYKDLEKRLKIQIRNGQMISGIKAGILFMIQELDKLAGDKLK